MKNASRTFVFVKLGSIISAALIAIAGFAGVFSNREMVAASAFGPSASHTNAPGENNCTACHTSFPLNSGSGSLTISGLPPNYGAGQQIPVTVTVQDSNAIIYGSQTTAIDTSGKAAGTFVPPAGTPQTMQVIAGIVDGNQRNYIEHTVDGLIPTQPGTKSWTFTWTAPSPRVGKVNFYTASNAANSDGTTNGDYIYATSASVLSGSALADFDSDGKSDISVWRPSSGTWYTLNSTDGGFQAVQWGVPGDQMVPGDYDGDGITDFAIWRPSTGVWYVLKSSGGVIVAQFGAPGDVPVPGDYDGDLKSDLAVWRPSTGVWYVYRSSGGGVDITQWGNPTDKPVQGDYDGDGKTDVAVFRPSNGTWYVWNSTQSASIISWGAPGDRPTQGDYDSDGKTDVAVYRPSDGTWYVYRSSDGAVNITQWGNSTDVPVPADYDGDGKTDVAVYRNGTWFILQSSNSAFSQVSWGTNEDLPVAAAYIAQ